MKKITIKPKWGILAISMLLVAAFTNAQTCPSGQIAYWKLQEPAGSVYSDEIGTHDAAASSTPSQIVGISGKGILLNSAANNEVHVPDHSDFDWEGDGDFSIHFWVKFTGTLPSGDPQVFIGRDDPSSSINWWIGRTQLGAISMYMRDDVGNNITVTSVGVHNTGSWVRVLAIKEGYDITLYANETSVSDDQTFSGDFVADGDAPIVFGDLRATNDEFSFNGGLDEIAFFDRVLTAQEISDFYTNTKDFEIGYCNDANPAFISAPSTSGEVGKEYTYDADASGNPKPTYELISGPQDMNLNATTGEITWTPASLNVNGNVVLRANSGSNYIDQQFIISIADDPVCRENLIEYWDLNELATYMEGNVNGDTLQGTNYPSVTTGIVDNGLYFDGVNDGLFMQDPEYDDGEGGHIPAFFEWQEKNRVEALPFSYEFWAKTAGGASDIMVMLGRYVGNSDAAYWIGTLTDGSVTASFRDYNGGVSTDINSDLYLIDDNNWHHIVVSYDDDANTLALYIDGYIRASTSTYMGNFGGGGLLTLGYLNTSTPNFYYNGALDEFAVYDYVLPADSVLKYYANGSPEGACKSNYAPVITSSPVVDATEDIEYTYNIVASDADGDDLTLSATLKPDWLTFDYTPGATTATLIGTPGDDDIDNHDITITVSDGSLDVQQSFTVSVVNVNDTPIITEAPKSTAMYDGKPYSSTINATDDDAADVLTFDLVEPLDSWLNWNTSTRTLSGIPGVSDRGEYTVTLRVSDGTVNVDTTFVINVKATNTAPVIDLPLPSLDADDYEAYDESFSATDDDNDVINLYVVNLPEWLEFNPSTGALTGMPIFSDAEKSFTFTIGATDGIDSTKQELTIQVTNRNDDPVITSVPEDTIYIGESYLYEITATDIDEDDVLTYSAPVLPDFLQIVNNSIIGTPTKDNVGSHPIYIEVTDSIGDVTQNFTLLVIDTTPPVQVSIDINKVALVNKVYPNPAQSQITFSLKEANDFTLKVFSMNGAIVRDMKVEYSESVVIDISNLTSGMYYYQVIVNEQVDLGRFSKY